MVCKTGVTISWTVAHALLHCDYLLGFVLPCKFNLGHCRHVVRRTPEEGRRGRGRRGRSTSGENFIAKKKKNVNAYLSSLITTERSFLFYSFHSFVVFMWTTFMFDVVIFFLMFSNYGPGVSKLFPSPHCFRNNFGNGHFGVTGS